MYKSAIRTNPAFLKRPNKQVSYSFRVLSPKREPANSKGLNAFNSFGVRGQRWLTEHYIKHRKELFSSNIHHLPTQLQRKWIIRSSKPLTDGINRINAVTIVRSARLFSGKSDEKENKDKKKTTSLGLGRNKDGDDNGCTLGKPGKKSLEASTISESCQTEVVHDQSSQVDNSERQQHSQTRHPDSEEKKKESKSSIVKRYIKKWPERKKVPADTGSSKKLEDFDRLQLLKGKLISKLGKQWLSWENITDTFDKFPYYISENTRDLLLECAAARLKKHELSKFGESLPSSSHLILLQGQPGTELYQEVLVRAVAQHLQVSLLVLDSNTLTAKDLKDDVHIAGSSINEHDDDDYKVTSNDNSHAENSGNAEVLSLKSLDSLKQVFGCPVKIIDFKNLGAKFGLPWKVHHVPDKKENKKKISKLVEPDNNYWADELKKLVVTVREDELKKLGKKGEELKKFWHDLIIGDRVRYKGPKASRAKTRTKVSIGQEGFVSSISDGLPWKVRVKFQGKHGTSDADEVFCDAAELEKVDSSASDEAWLARFPELPIEALCKMVLYRGRVIVYFPDFQQWFASAPPSKGRGLLLKKVKDLLSKVNSPVVFIASRIKEDSSTPAAVSLGLESILPPSMFFEASKPSPTASEGEEDSDRVFKIFKNVIRVFPPEEPQLLHTWQKHLEEDKKSAKKRRNHMLLEESLQQHGMSCVELANINTLDLHLTSESAEDVIGWARNMSLHSNQIQISEGKLLLEKKCLEKSLMRLKALKASSEEKISHIMELTENEYEKSFFSSVVLAHDIGVKFDEIGALDNVKSTLKDLIVLPLQRPELFTRGNLRKPCKGVLLFGPPGTGKTLMAKAVATEAGANFINVSASSITSKFYGDDEKLVKGLFTLARKLSPVVIFIDEVDSLLGARGHSSEHEATRRIKNEFMASWDGLQSKENEQILVFATTNRPFDLDDAVIRRLPRRLLIDLPNVENRARILRIILANEDLDDTFNYDTLAAQTEGYSGSDLKNLCVAAAYTPIREFLAAEQQVKGSSEGENSLSQTAMVVRPLCLEDFIQAKSKVGVSVAYDAASMIQMRQWNEQYGEGGSRSQIVFGFSQ